MNNGELLRSIIYCLKHLHKQGNESLRLMRYNNYLRQRILEHTGISFKTEEEFNNGK